MKYQQKQVSVRDVVFGKNVTIVEPSNIYECNLGDDCFVGPFVEIQKDVTIGNNCRIQSHSFICSLVSMGNNCFVGHGAIFLNDLFTNGGPAGNPSLWKKTTIGNNVYFGSNSTILPVSICDNVVIGAGAVVTKNITNPGVYAGNPARKLR
jgi:acetyltransferase-like isoleucine patch superfamily enzyme